MEDINLIQKFILMCFATTAIRLFQTLCKKVISLCVVPHGLSRAEFRNSFEYNTWHGEKPVESKNNSDKKEDSSKSNKDSSK